MHVAARHARIRLSWHSYGISPSHPYRNAYVCMCIYMQTCMCMYCVWYFVWWLLCALFSMASVCSFLYRCLLYRCLLCIHVSWIGSYRLLSEVYASSMYIGVHMKLSLDDVSCVRCRLHRHSLCGPLYRYTRDVSFLHMCCMYTTCSVCSTCLSCSRVCGTCLSWRRVCSTYMEGIATHASLFYLRRVYRYAGAAHS